MVYTDRAHSEMLRRGWDVGVAPERGRRADDCAVELSAGGARYCRLGGIGELTDGMRAWNAGAAAAESAAERAGTTDGSK